MKKILIDVNSIVGLYVRGYLSGIGRTTYELVSAMAKLDNLPFDVTLYSQNMKGIGARNMGLFKSKHLYLPHRRNYDRFVGMLPIKELFTSYDLLHIPHNFEFVHAPQKTIVTLHDALFMKMQESAFSHERMKQEVPPLIRACKAIITCSDCSKRDIVETMDVEPDKIHVIPWGVRHDIFFPIQDKVKVRKQLEGKFGFKAPYFFSVSCNMDRKNTPRLIDVYIELAQKGIKNDLCLVWNAPQKIRDKVFQAGMEDRIHFVNNVSDDELRLLYAGATATIFLSLYEGFGLPILESMACGTPVISSDTSSLPEVGGDAPIYIDPMDNISIREALMSFESNNYNRDNLIQKGIARAAGFSWKRCAEETIKVYQQYLTQK